MTELERRRDARELWVSRSHLHAAVVGAGLLAVLSFSLGMVVGRGSVGASEPMAARTLVSDVPGQELVELLAVVERGAAVNASKQVIYEDVLERRLGAPVPEAAPEVHGVQASVPPAPSHPAPFGDTVPTDGYTVELGVVHAEAQARALVAHLSEAGLAPWVEHVRVDGEARYRLGVGSMPTEAEAAALLPQVAEVVSTAEDAVGGLHVVALAQGPGEPSEPAPGGEPVEEPAAAP